MSITLERKTEEIRKDFYKLNTNEDLAELLEIKYSQLIYYLFVSADQQHYKRFEIPKKSGGFRKIFAPVTPLKIIQKKLSQIFESVYIPKYPVHGFVKERSILTNAMLHTNKNYVFNLDLENFFPEIHFGRVRGLFLNFPYFRNGDISTALARLTCLNGKLPQGSPSSPIISNMICAKMDSQLRRFAEINRSFYSRYADDVTFSTTLREFPEDIAELTSDGVVEVGKKLELIINQNGFAINYEKVRLQSKYSRQVVTGLTVNQFPNVNRKFVRKIRAMLFDWKENGIDRAEERHHNMYYSKVKRENGKPRFKKILKGNIDFLGMVKGKNDPIYLRYFYEYVRLDKDWVIYQPYETTKYSSGRSPENSFRKVYIFTEGKTDWKHLKGAYILWKQKISTNLEIIFDEFEDEKGNSKLLRNAKAYSEHPEGFPFPQIFLFDNDDDKYLRDAGLTNELFSEMGKNVFTMKLPVPSHRENEKLSIELLYKDEDLFTADSHGRRIFLSDEFNIISGRHNSQDLVCQSPKRLKGSLKVIDSNVYNTNNQNVALTKNEFSVLMFKKLKSGENIDISGFELVFNKIDSLL